MSDALAALATANPVPASRHDDIEARARGLAGCWATVEPMVTPSPRGRRYYALAIAVAVALLAAGTALALRADWLDFSEAEPAPPRVMKGFADLDVQAPPGMAPNAIASEARRIPVTDNAGQVRTFWVAPTRQGGWCVDIANVGGGCDKLGAFPLNITWAIDGGPVVDHSLVTGIYGFARARWLDSVVVRFADGSKESVEGTWISPPIGGAFFYYDVPAAHRAPGHQVVLVDGLQDGQVVTTQYSNPAAEPVPSPDALADEKTALARADTPDGEAIVWSAPTRYGATCRWVQIGGSPRSLAGGSCLPAVYANAREVRWIPTPHSVVIAGRFGPRFDHVELTFADYSHATAPLDDGVLLYVVPSDHLTPATALAEIRAIPAGRGVPINVEVLPGLSGCQAPLPSNEDCG
jgi:hypothetical protein